MSKENDRAPNQWMRLRVKFASQCKRLLCFLKNRKFDFRFKLIAMSIMSLIIGVVGGVLAAYGFLGAGYAFVFFISGAMLGLLVLGTLTAHFLEQHFAEFKSAKFFGFGLFALVTYVAHGKAVGEINAIFQIDASAFPHATTAASAMIISTWISWALLVPICFVSLICSIYHYTASKAGNTMISAAVFIACFLWTSLIEHQAAPDGRRKGNLYQIALEMDFNKRSHCLGLPEGSEGVVFIGPDQLRAIVAPRKVEIQTNSKSIFREIQLPEKFDIVNCL